MAFKIEKGERLNNIPMPDIIGYGFGNLGFGIVFQIIATYLVFYGTVIQDIPGSLIGLAVSIGVIWDGLTDPLMGYISDKTDLKRFGRRHIYVLVGCVGIAVFNYFLWVVDKDMPVLAKFIWILVDLILIKSFLTIYATPYTALGAELSSDYNERTTIQGTKTIFFLTGIGLATVMAMYLFFKPTIQYPDGQFNPAAYKYLGLTASLLMLTSGLVCYFFTSKYIPLLPKPSRSGNNKGWHKRLINDFKAALVNKDYRYIVFAYLFTNIASALVSTFGLHVFTYTFKMNNTDIAFVFATQLLVCIIGQPIWVQISKRLDKKASAILGLVITIIGSFVFMGLVFMKNIVGNNILYMLPYAILTGFGTSGLFTLPLSMIADTIDIEEMKLGIRTEGVYYGCLTLFYKLSQSVVILLLGIILDVIKFNPNIPVQPESTLYILGLTLPVGSIISFAIALLCYSRYSLNKDMVAYAQQQILSKNKNVETTE